MQNKTPSRHLRLFHWTPVRLVLLVRMTPHTQMQPTVWAKCLFLMSEQFVITGLQRAKSIFSAFLILILPRSQVARLIYVLSLDMYPPCINPFPTAFPYGNGTVLHFYQQQENSTTKTVHKVINKGLKAYVQSLYTGENFH